MKTLNWIVASSLLSVAVCLPARAQSSPALMLVEQQQQQQQLEVVVHRGQAAIDHVRAHAGRSLWLDVNDLALRLNQAQCTVIGRYVENGQYQVQPLKFSGLCNQLDRLTVIDANVLQATLRP